MATIDESLSVVKAPSEEVSSSLQEKKEDNLTVISQPKQIEPTLDEHPLSLPVVHAQSGQLQLSTPVPVSLPVPVSVTTPESPGDISSSAARPSQLQDSQITPTSSVSNQQQPIVTTIVISDDDDEVEIIQVNQQASALQDMDTDVNVVDSSSSVNLIKSTPAESPRTDAIDMQVTTGPVNSDHSISNNSNESPIDSPSLITPALSLISKAGNTDTSKVTATATPAIAMELDEALITAQQQKATDDDDDDDDDGDDDDDEEEKKQDVRVVPLRRTSRVRKERKLV